MDVRAGFRFSAPSVPESRLRKTHVSANLPPNGTATQTMPSPVFPPPQFVGASSSVLRPFCASLSSAVAPFYSPNPDVHPGFVDPSWLPRRGVTGPKLAPKTIIAPMVSPGSIVRGLGWGLALTLAGAWLDDIDAQVKGQLDYQGEPYPETDEAQIGQVVLAVAQACAQTDAETKPMLAPEALPRRRRNQTDEDEKEPEPPPRRWKIFAHTRAGKVTR